MTFLRSVKTLREGLGSLGTRIWRSVLDVGAGLVEAIGFGREAGVEAEPAPTWREGYQVSVAMGREADFSVVEPTAYVPADWYEQSTIPWDKPLAYKVAVFGRDLATGRFARQELDITVSRPLTAAEAVDECVARLGLEGASPLFDIWSAKLVGASRREGEPWRW